MRRFYTSVATEALEAGYGVTLDGRPLRTPAKRRLVVPTAALGESIAEEWRGQGDELDLLSLGHTQLANTAIDRLPVRRAAIVEEVSGYARSDLLCHRADSPAELVRRQAAHWQPLLDWAADVLGAALAVTEGIVPIDQPAAALDAVRRAVEDHDDMRLAALHTATGACGSVVVALALAAGRIDAADAFAAAHVDEQFQMERWGADTEAEARLDRVRAEIESAGAFLALCRAA